MKINQFHSGTALGDAITNQMLDIQKILINAGYESEIYAEHIADKIKEKVNDINTYKGNANNILIIHHSMGFDLFEKIIALPDKKVIIYHNITPEKYFSDTGTKKYIRIGLKQIQEYKKYVDYAIADSNFNRRQMITMGYQNVDVMPVHVSLRRFENITSDTKIKQRFSGCKNILFVGRVVPNKCQDDIIKSFAVYLNNFERNANLILPGDLSYAPYVEKIKNISRDLEIENKVHLLGKVTEEELKACYEVADVFLCLSEHEGFGVPLLEAMKEKIPVVAYDSSAVSETMNGAGILVEEKNYALIAGLIDEIINNNDLRNNIVRVQNLRISKLEKTETKPILLNAIKNVIDGTRKRRVQMQGPFETSYSLAIVNRKLIEAIDDLGKDDVSIYCTEGPGDYEPKEDDLKDKEHAKQLWIKSQRVTYPDIVIRNMYPPRVADSNGALNFQSFAWEESRVPEQYVKSFNKYLDGIGTTSAFVTKALKDSGIVIPICTIGNGVELPCNYEQILPYKLKTSKNNIFLHISSAFPRKGVDLLVQAYCNAFSSYDDVCLVIKTFPNPHNIQLIKYIDELAKNSESPEIELINEDLPSDKLYGLYKSANCYVHSARGEGFGLPVAEAMLAKVPVIVSPNTGMADFCTEETAILVDYIMEEADTHLSIAGSMWAKPDVEILGRRMKEFIQCPQKLHIEEKKEKAYNLISQKYTWKAVAKRWENFIDEVVYMKRKPKVSMVTTWNTKCGIAEYSKMQCEAMKNLAEFKIYPNYGESLICEDEKFVEQRVWHSAFEGDLERLIENLSEDTNEIIHIQFNYGFFKLSELRKLIERLCEVKKIIITFHKTKEADVLGKTVSLQEISETLNQCYRLVVHQEEDKLILEDYGVESELIQIIPLGQVEYEQRQIEELREKLGISSSLVLGSYGFLLPHKGVLENIEAVKILKEEYPDVLYIVCCSLHSSKQSRLYYEKCIKAVEEWDLKNNVIFITEYLPNDESIVILQSCDILLMTYLRTGESASGAVRFCLAARRPIVLTNQPIFKEFFDCAYIVKCGDIKGIRDTVSNYKKNIDSTFLNLISKKIAETSWKNISVQWRKLYEEAEGELLR